MKPIRLIYLITTLNQGGTERNLIQYCQALDKSKYDLSVWYLCETENSLRPQLEQAGINLRCLGASGGVNFSDLYSIGKTLAKSKADLIHVFLPTVGYYGVASKLMFRSKIPMVFSSGGVQLVLPFQAQMMKYGVGRYCNPVICNSNFVKQFWVDKGLDPERLRVISNGHEIGKYDLSETREELRNRFSIDNDEFAILCVGRLIASKRIPDLLRAYSVLKDKVDRKLTLRIAGDGVEMKGLCTLAAELGLNADSIFLGQR